MRQNLGINSNGDLAVCQGARNINPMPTVHKACVKGHFMGFEQSCLPTCMEDEDQLQYSKDGDEVSKSYVACKSFVKKPRPNHQLPWCRRGFDYAYEKTKTDISNKERRISTDSFEEETHELLNVSNAVIGKKSVSNDDGTTGTDANTLGDIKVNIISEQKMLDNDDDDEEGEEKSQITNHSEGEIQPDIFIEKQDAMPELVDLDEDIVFDSVASNMEAITEVKFKGEAETVVKAKEGKNSIDIAAESKTEVEGNYLIDVEIENVSNENLASLNSEKHIQNIIEEAVEEKVLEEEHTAYNLPSVSEF